MNNISAQNSTKIKTVIGVAGGVVLLAGAALLIVMKVRKAKQLKAEESVAEKTK